MVLKAVATSELVFFIPHFAKIAVSPAKTAENTAATIHIKFTSISPLPYYNTGSITIQEDKKKRAVQNELLDFFTLPLCLRGSRGWT